MQNVMCNYQAMPGKVVNFRADSQYGRYNPQAGVPQDMVVIQNQRMAEQQQKQNSRDNWQKAGVIGTFALAAGIVASALITRSSRPIKIAGGAGKEGLEGMGSSKLRELDCSGATGLDNIQNPDLKGRIDLLKQKLKQRYLSKALGRSENMCLMLCGKPGGGKTDTVKSLGQYYKELYGDAAKVFELDPTATGSIFKDGAEMNVQAYIESVIEYAKQNPNTRVVLFIDEFDSFAAKDLSSNAAHSDKMANVFKRIFDATKQPNIDLIMATNKVEKGQPLNKYLNDAIVSRIDETIFVDLPTATEFQNATLKDLAKAKEKHPELFDKDLADILDGKGSSTDQNRIKEICDFITQEEHDASYREKNKLVEFTQDMVMRNSAGKIENQAELDQAIKDGKVQKLTINNLAEAARQLSKQKEWVSASEAERLFK